jgi:hypothetical protein
VAITTSYGTHELAEFKVFTDEVPPGGPGPSWRRRGQFLTPFCQVRPKAIAAATAACQGTNSRTMASSKAAE